jgi:hypothetical protein
MMPERHTDRVGSGEVPEATRAGAEGRPVANGKETRVQLVPCEQDARPVVEDGDVSVLVARDWKYDQAAIAQVEFCFPLRPIRQIPECLYLLEREAHDCRPRAIHELGVPEDVVAMSVRMGDNQG